MKRAVDFAVGGVVLWGLCLALIGNERILASETALPEPTDRLTICVEEYCYTESELVPVAECFRENFPQVELEVITLPEVPVFTAEYEAPREAAVNQIKTQVMSGGGPDLFLLDVGKSSYSGNTENLFEDLEKSARAGIFCDLGALMKADGTIDMDDFYPFVEDAGTIDGSMVLFPLAFWSYSAVTTRDNLEKIGFHSEDAQASMDAFYEQTDACLTEEQKIHMAMTYYTNLSYPLLDYDTGEVRIGEAEKKYFERTKESDRLLMEKQDGSLDMADKAKLILDETAPVMSGLLSAQFGLPAIAEVMAKQGEDALFLLFPDEQGEGVAFIDSYAAINANSQNKRNALEFLKILLSEEMQAKGCYSNSGNLPVRRGKEILASYLQVKMEETRGWGASAVDGEALSDTSLASLTEVLERTKVGRIQKLYYLPINGELTFADYYDQYLSGEITYEEFSEMVSEGLEFYWEE